MASVLYSLFGGSFLEVGGYLTCGEELSSPETAQLSVRA